MSEKRDKRLHLRITASELEKIRNDAEHANLSVVEYVRETLGKDFNQTIRNYQEDMDIICKALGYKKWKHACSDPPLAVRIVSDIDAQENQLRQIAELLDCSLADVEQHGKGWRFDSIVTCLTNLKKRSDLVNDFRDTLRAIIKEVADDSVKVDDLMTNACIDRDLVLKAVQAFAEKHKTTKLQNEARGQVMQEDQACQDAVMRELQEGFEGHVTREQLIETAIAFRREYWKLKARFEHVHALAYDNWAKITVRRAYQFFVYPILSFIKRRKK